MKMRKKSRLYPKPEIWIDLSEQIVSQEAIREVCIDALAQSLFRNRGQNLPRADLSAQTSGHVLG